MIDGVGKDADIVINENGGMQSKAIGRFDLIPPQVLEDYGNIQVGLPNQYSRLLASVYKRMTGKVTNSQLMAEIFYTEPKYLEIIAKVLEEGAEKYSRNNWRLIPAAEHFNHALIHLYALIEGDTQDDHYAHFLTRIAMFVEQDENNYDFKLIE